MRLANSVTRIDVRSIAPVDRHALIFKTFESLKARDALELLWLVKIDKVADVTMGAPCCGHCNA